MSGNDMFSARVKSFPIVPLSAWSALAPPNSAAELRMRALLRRDRVEDRLDALVGGVAVAPDLERAAMLSCISAS